jgi:hypothetical protein
MTCQNLQNKLLNITVLFTWYLLQIVGEFKKKCHSPNMASSISFWRVLISVHSPTIYNMNLYDTFVNIIFLRTNIALCIQCGKPYFSNTRQNGEWTEISTRQNEIELAMFGE